jgi:hypothetical protein
MRVMRVMSACAMPMARIMRALRHQEAIRPDQFLPIEPEHQAWIIVGETRAPSLDVLAVLFVARTAMAFQFQSVAAVAPLVGDSLFAGPNLVRANANCAIIGTGP